MKQKILKRNLSLIILAIFSTNFAFGQISYNHTYREVEEKFTKNPRGKSLLTDNECSDIITVNSILNSDGFYDFQLSIIEESSGAILNSFHYGNDLGNDYCNGVSKSLSEPNRYILCGKSSKNNMLVMEVDDNGGIVWSKEIIFDSYDSEAINVLSVGDSDEGAYLIVGTADIEIAVAKLDLSGNLIFSNQYTMNTPYVSNSVTDAVILEERLANGTINQACIITGTQRTPTSIIPKNLFTMQIDVITGSPIWDHSIYNILNQGSIHGLASIYNPQIVAAEDYPNVFDTNGNNFRTDNFLVTFAQTSTSFTSIDQISVLKSNPKLSYDWINSFYGGPQNLSECTTNDIIHLSSDNDEFAILANEHTLPGVYNPLVLHIDENGDLIAPFSYNLVEKNVSSSSILENCEEQLIHNGTEQASNPYTSYSRVTKTDSQFEAQCFDQFRWDSYSPEVIEIDISIDDVEIGATEDYDSYATQVDHEVFDCEEEQFQRLRSTSLQENNTLSADWFFPNPASAQLNLQLTDEKETINIYNKLGQNVLTKHLSGSVRLDISQLSTGIYIIEKVNSLGKISNEKLIIY